MVGGWVGWLVGRLVDMSVGGWVWWGVMVSHHQWHLVLCMYAEELQQGSYVKHKRLHTVKSSIVAMLSACCSANISSWLCALWWCLRCTDQHSMCAVNGVSVRHIPDVVLPSSHALCTCVTECTQLSLTTVMLGNT